MQLNWIILDLKRYIICIFGLNNKDISIILSTIGQILSSSYSYMSSFATWWIYFMMWSFTSLWRQRKRVRSWHLATKHLIAYALMPNIIWSLQNKPQKMRRISFPIYDKHVVRVNYNLWESSVAFSSYSMQQPFPFARHRYYE